MEFAADWIQPDWPAPPWVKAVFTTRQGGVSTAPFDSFNLGDHVRDEAAAVAANRARLAEVLGQRPVFLQQVHGTAVRRLQTDTPDGTVADACLCVEPGLACAIMVADCLPVLFAHRSARVIAAAHAGWRGLAGEGGVGVLETTVAAFIKAVQELMPQLGAEQVRADSLVWLGPCIGPQAFEVGAEVRAAFVDERPAAAAHFTPVPQTGKYRADLAALARQRLLALGLAQVFGNDSGPAWCTFNNASRFFSHRRDSAVLGSTGRMAACIALR